MLVCDACDKGYHTFCLQPAMESLPSDPWKCRVSHSPLYKEMALPQNMFVFTKVFKRDIVRFASLIIWFTFDLFSLLCQRCRVCTECGVRGLVLSGSAQWFDNYAICEGCQRHRSSTCGVCSKAAEPSVILHCCSMCHRSAQYTSTVVFNRQLSCRGFLLMLS